MIQYKGKHNSANVMTDTVDTETSSQIYQFLNHPAFANTYIAIMPDCHKGAGAVIGFTAKMNDYVIPNVVGVDIGCGVLAVNLGHFNWTGKKDFEHLDHHIRQHIPSGFNIRSKNERLYNRKTINDYLNTSIKNDIAEAADVTRQDMARVSGSVGTLGGGNHFIEIDYDDIKDEYWLLIHSGSRNFGLKIANYYQKQAKDLLAEMFVGADAYKQLEYLPLDKGGDEYLEAMQIAQEYASLNRQVMAELIVDWLCDNSPFNSMEKFDTVHNYINFDDRIIRKGAVSAHKEERLVIPFNMRDGVAICVGKGNSKWNYSAPHGAGRVLSRSKAKKELSLDEFQETMKGVYTTTATLATLDEAPMAYKDKDEIVKAIDETVEIEFYMKPVYNFKATGE